MIALGIVFDIAVLIAAVTFAVLILGLLIRRQFKSFDVRMGNMGATLTGIDTKVEAVNTAVNNVPAGEPTLIARVQRLEAHHEKLEVYLEQHQTWERAALQEIADHVGVKIPSGRKAS